MDIVEGLEKLRRVIKEYAQEVPDIWDKRDDTSEDQGIRTGRLHENHILGIIIKHDLEDLKDVTTSDIEEEYRIFFRKIARSTVSTYLNQLEKECVLFKKRDGRTVKYLFQIPPPKGLNPFWIVRNFCLLPSYISRAITLTEMYLKEPQEKEKYVKERKFLIGLAILNVLKNRFDKCSLCQFGNRTFYKSSTEDFEKYIKERIDVLPDDLRTFVLKELGEIPLFGGIIINPTDYDEVFKKILENVEIFHNDIGFQEVVSKRRQKIHLDRMEKNVKKEDESETETSKEKMDKKIGF
ncbi:MAG: hypothetical protein ACTSU2_15310 [Promethearchaeota archaeon]